MGISVLDSTDAEARVVEGLITGVGFIGMAVAYQRYEVALLMSIINFVALRFVQRWKQHGHQD
ncbi:MAG: hypothetical protein ACNA8G_09765 [Gammaproteobacteria bacterium]